MKTQRENLLGTVRNTIVHSVHVIYRWVGLVWMKDRKVKEEIVFKNHGTFTAYWDAEKWCKDNDYSYGSMCAPMPTAIMKGDFNIAKWRNLSRKEQSESAWNYCTSVTLF